MPVTSRKVVIVKRPTRLDQLVARFNSIQQVKFYIEHIEGDFLDYDKEHRNYYAALKTVCDGISCVARTHLVDWLQVPNYQFNPDDIVATVGQDGLIANSIKYLKDQPIVGFNSDQSRWDGALAQFKPEESASIIEDCLAGAIAVKRITKGVVTLSDKQTLHAVNDFFVGVNSHSSARYSIQYNGKKESHSSSGVIVSTPLGRSAWMKSVITGANGIVNRIHNKKTKIAESANADAWDDDCLYFAVREPFPSVSSETAIVFGKITADSGFTIESKMGENGIVFSDGIQADFLNFNYSMKSTFGIAKEKGTLVVRP